MRSLTWVFVCVLGLLAKSHVAEAAPSAHVTRVHIKKEDHTLTLYAGDTVVASYRVALGPGGTGPKRREGDRRTPVGRYHVIAHAPSQYKVFLRLDYPNDDDRRRFARAKREGELGAEARIGGDIGIHGPPQSMAVEDRAGLKASDWTLGCIALDDGEIAEVARRVRDGTVVDIED